MKENLKKINALQSERNLKKILKKSSKEQIRIINKYF